MKNTERSKEKNTKKEGEGAGAGVRSKIEAGREKANKE